MVDDYAELCTFANVEYTPAWYYKKFPGFYNVNVTEYLLDWHKVSEESEQENKKRKIENVEEEDGVEETKHDTEDSIHSF